MNRHSIINTTFYQGFILVCCQETTKNEKRRIYHLSFYILLLLTLIFSLLIYSYLNKKLKSACLERIKSQEKLVEDSMTKFNTYLQNITMIPSEIDNLSILIDRADNRDSFYNLCKKAYILCRSLNRNINQAKNLIKSSLLKSHIDIDTFESLVEKGNLSANDFLNKVKDLNFSNYNEDASIGLIIELSEFILKGCLEFNLMNGKSIETFPLISTRVSNDEVRSSFDVEHWKRRHSFH